MKRRLVLLPDEKFDDLVRKYSSAITDKYPSYFQLDEQHIPHITIEVLEFEIESLPKVKKLMDKLLEGEYNFTIMIDEIKTSSSNFINVYFKNDESIRKLQTYANNLLRTEVKLTDKKMIPHITLTRLKDEKYIEDAIRLIKDFKRENYNIKYLAICTEGDHGTCTKILHKLRLN